MCVIRRKIYLIHIEIIEYRNTYLDILFLMYAINV